LDEGSACRKAATYTQDNTNRINVHTDIHALSGSNIFNRTKFVGKYSILLFQGDTSISRLNILLCSYLICVSLLKMRGAYNYVTVAISTNRIEDFLTWSEKKPHRSFLLT
jgi:hypothetical protein